MQSITYTQGVCSDLQCVAICCSVLQCVAVCCSVWQCVAVRCSALQCVAVCCSVLQCIAVCCSVLQNHVSSILERKEGRGILRANNAQNSINSIIRLLSARCVLQ